MNAGSTFLLLLAQPAPGGAGAATLGRVTGSAAGSSSNPGSGSPSLGRVTGSASGSSRLSGSGAGTLGRLAGAGSGESSSSGPTPVIRLRSLRLFLCGAVIPEVVVAHGDIPDPGETLWDLDGTEVDASLTEWVLA